MKSLVKDSIKNILNFDSRFNGLLGEAKNTGDIYVSNDLTGILETFYNAIDEIPSTLTPKLYLETEQKMIKLNRLQKIF